MKEEISEIPSDVDGARELEDIVDGAMIQVSLLEDVPVDELESQFNTFKRQVKAAQEAKASEELIVNEYKKSIGSGQRNPR